MLTMCKYRANNDTVVQFALKTNAGSRIYFTAKIIAVQNVTSRGLLTQVNLLELYSQISDYNRTNYSVAFCFMLIKSSVLCLGKLLCDCHL